MTTEIALTLHLLLVIGVYELVAGAAGLTGRLSYPGLIDNFIRMPALTFITGFIVYVLGAALLLVHCHWTDVPAIIVSAVGVIMVAEGLVMMAWPDPILAWSKRLVGYQRPFSLLAMLVGAALIFIALTGEVSPTTIA